MASRPEQFYTLGLLLAGGHTQAFPQRGPSPSAVPHPVRLGNRTESRRRSANMEDKDASNFSTAKAAPTATGCVRQIPLPIAKMIKEHDAATALLAGP